MKIIIKANNIPQPQLGYFYSVLAANDAIDAIPHQYIDGKPVYIVWSLQLLGEIELPMDRFQPRMIVRNDYTFPAPMAE